MSCNVIDTQGLFAPFDVLSAVELTLGANQNLSDATRLQWNVKGHSRTAGSEYTNII